MNTMNWVNSILIFVVAFLAVFMEAYVEIFRDLLGAQINVLPGLMVCAGLTRSIGTTACLAICSGLWYDSLSSNPLGVSVLPLFFIGFIIHQSRELLLRQNAFAHFALGLSASLFCPLLTVFLMLNIGSSPLLGWKTVWQFLIMTIGGGLMTPVLFKLFEWLDGSLNYQPASQSSFRPDREIKHRRRI